jgi:ATP-dependent RNA helicase DDX5/DBP2
MFKYVKLNSHFLLGKSGKMLNNFFVNNSNIALNICKFNFTQKNSFSEKYGEEYRKLENMFDNDGSNSSKENNRTPTLKNFSKSTLTTLKSQKVSETEISVKKDVYRDIPENENIKFEDIEKFHKEHSINITFDKMKEIPPPMFNFTQLNFTKDINDLIKKKFSNPTPIQSIGWPIALKGFNMVGIAETGSGKTLSYILPALMHIREQKNSNRSGPTVLIVSPTRELANQINTVIEDFCSALNIRSACLYGGVSKGNQIRQLQRGVDIVVATPGRLLDIINMRKTSLDRTSFVILDEADRMLDMGFEVDLRKILGQVHSNAQILMWSATWPIEIRKLANEFLKEYVHIKIGNGEGGLSLNKRIEQKFKFCTENKKFQSLSELLTSIHFPNKEVEEVEESQEVKKASDSANPHLQKIMIFTNFKYKCDDLVNDLRNKFNIDSIHGDKSQYERDLSIRRFKNGETKILVATDVAARGLDISDVKVIINYDYPNCLDDYVHRIGRTGRSGKTGISYTLWSEENDQRAKPLIELLKKAEQPIPEELFERMNSRSRSRSSSKSKFSQRRYR